MGTVLQIRVGAADREAGLSAAEAAFGAVRQLDDVISTWHESELQRLNTATPGMAVPVSADLARLLREVWTWSAATGGAFDPGIGALVDAWDLRGRGRRPADAQLRVALAATGSEHFFLDRRRNAAMRLHAAAWLDSGGFGKGAALRIVRDTLVARGIGQALVNFGGQVLAIGPERDRGTVVWVAHPARRDEGAIALRLRDHSASTTSQSERGIEVNGQRFGHILDPRTGHPVPAWGSVTIVARDPMTADILSTALFVLGPERGLAWANERADVGALFLVYDAGSGLLDARWNRTMGRFLHRDPTRFSEAICDLCAP